MVIKSLSSTGIGKKAKATMFGNMCLLLSRRGFLRTMSHNKKMNSQCGKTEAEINEHTRRNPSTDVGFCRCLKFTLVTIV